MDSFVAETTGTGRGRRLVNRLLIHLEIGRPDLMFYSGFVGIAGVVFTADTWTVWHLLGAWAAPTFGWFAAMYGGDYFDRDLDRITKSQRPIPSGRMNPRAALVGMITWALLGMAIAVALNPINLLMVVLAWSFGIAYSKFLKARGVWGNLSRGAITMCAFATGAFAVADTPPLTLVPIALIFGLHDAASNVVGALCDQEGDRQGGYRTFPVRHGETASLQLTIALHLLWVVIAVVYPLAVFPTFQPIYYVPILTISTGMVAVSIAMVLRSPRPIPRVTALKSHEVLVIERLVLVGALVAGASGFWLGVGLTVPFVIATFASSLLLMRGSYEPSRRWRSRRVARRLPTEFSKDAV